MEVKKYKVYLHFALTVVLFLTILLINLIIYLNWDKETTEENANLVEVNLPIIEWGKYANLSKQYETSIIKEN